MPQARRKKREVCKCHKSEVCEIETLFAKEASASITTRVFMPPFLETGDIYKGGKMPLDQIFHRPSIPEWIPLSLPSATAMKANEAAGQEFHV